ncbi:MAG: plasma-membrane proton-efflux P-type ATPase [Candidatus Rehaiarchaeum fermentans]|nr:plasma-membrane proton-efflux P-type ATPase [Candidatus Rehaiarchaeum fermentans]
MEKTLSKLKIEQVLKELNVDAQKGISYSDWKNRIKKYGFNEIPEKKENPIVTFLKKFTQFSSITLEILLVIYFIIHQYILGFVVLALLLFNASISFFHEKRSSEAVEMLRHKLQIKARVLREGEWKLIDSKELVPGDIIRVRGGDICPADIRIISNDEIGVDESDLTGESYIVSKKYGDTIFSGAIIRRGEANGVVIYTGLNTYYGKTIDLVQTAKPKLHIEELTTKVISYLLIIVGSLAAIISIFSIYLYGFSLFIKILPLLLSLLLFAIPVALSAMLTTTMALGSLELAKKGVLITKLSAVEDAASMDVLCIDKTGTLTYDKLSITEIIPNEGFSEKDVILYGFLASRIEDHDPIDNAFIKKARELNLIYKYKLTKFIPFDPSLRRTEAHLIINNKNIIVSKGAINTILKLTNSKIKKEIENKVNDLESKGYKTLGIAIKDKEWKFVGIVALYDYPREDAYKFISELKENKIDVKMLTGDSLTIAKEIAQKVGINGNAIRGEEIRKIFLKNKEKAMLLAEKSNIFAEIYPEDKYYIVKSLQRNKHIVGMTGDGVNDSPSLRQAEVGISVKDAVDVAKSSANVVLMKEGLEEIVNLVEIGRSVYQRVVTWILTKINRTFQIALFVLLVMFYSLIFMHRPIYVLSSIDVILFFFLIDFFTISLSTDNEPGSKYPEKWNFRKMFTYAGIMGFLSFLEMLILLIIIYHIIVNPSLGVIQTLFFLATMIFGVLMPFVFRTQKRFYEQRAGKALLISTIVDLIIATIFSAFGIFMVRINLEYILFIYAYSLLCVFLINDSFKILLQRFGINR